MPDDCIFCRIAANQIAADLVYEDDEFVALADMNPQAPIHVLLIPREHFASILEIADERLLGRAQKAIAQAATKLGLAAEGFRVVNNCGENGGQTVSHVHWHILGGRFMQWPPG